LGTDNSADEAVAHLCSRDNSLELKFSPIKLNDPQHKGWISYRIQFLRLGEREFVLESTRDMPLFLDATIQPEIPIICNGIWTALQNNGCFEFEPLDDRDFCLSVACEHEFPTVTINFADVIPPPDFPWTKGVEVTRESLMRFAKQVENLYELF